MSTVRRGTVCAALVALAAVLTGCGMPGAPLPPSLHLPDPVTDLAARRTGNQVALTWTMPQKDTDKLLLKDNVTVRVCRKLQNDAACSPAGEVHLAPGMEGQFTELLPAALATGTPRSLIYLVELTNRNGRSAGPSNAAVVVAGQAPPRVEALTAEVRKQGVVLHWTPAPAADEVAVRLHRRLLQGAAAPPKQSQGPLAPAPEPLERNLLVDANPQKPGTALDTSIHFGEAYEYEAQRVVRVSVNGTTMELDGAFSAPLRVDAAEVFPPAIPAGLAAVALTGGNGVGAAIDLNWQPNAEAVLAGYVVYRREGDGPWQRISSAQLVVAPAFHDDAVQAGHTYRYAVSAVDQGGHESARSAEAEETVPNP